MRLHAEGLSQREIGRRVGLTGRGVGQVIDRMSGKRQPDVYDPDATVCMEYACDEPVSARGLCRRHYHRRWRSNTLPEPRRVRPKRSGYGVRGVLDDDGSTVLCHECGERLPMLGDHLFLVHHMSTPEYRQKHGLPKALRLGSAGTLSKRCEVADCGRPMLARGLCRGHYRRWRLGDMPEWRRPVACCDCGSVVRVEPAGDKRRLCDACRAARGEVWRAIDDGEAPAAIAERLHMSPERVARIIAKRK